MHRTLGSPQSQTEPVQQGEVRWIERLQQRPLPAPAQSVALDAAQDELWISRLQRGPGSQPL